MSQRVDRQPAKVRKYIHFQSVQYILSIGWRPGSLLHLVPFSGNLTKSGFGCAQALAPCLVTLLQRIPSSKQDASCFGPLVPSVS